VDFGQRLGHYTQPFLWLPHLPIRFGQQDRR